MRMEAGSNKDFSQAEGIQNAAVNDNDAPGAAFLEVKKTWADQGNLPESFTEEDVKNYLTEQLKLWSLKMTSQLPATPEEVAEREAMLKKLLHESRLLNERGFIRHQTHQELMNVVCTTINNGIGNRLDNL